MRKRLYLHVGMDKTGTSAIQKFVYDNRSKLLDDGDIYYPATGLWGDYSHHPFAFSIFNQHGYSEKKLLKLTKKLVKEVEGRNNVLISSECLFKAPLKENFRIFRDNIFSCFDDVRVIVYVRRQDHWVESRHKHSILSGSELPLEMLQRPFFCNYKQFIDHWSDLVGEESVVVRAYEKQQFVGGSIFSDFLSIFGIELSERYKIPIKNINYSLANDENKFKRLCNLIGFTRRGVEALNGILLEHASSSRSLLNSRLLSPTDRLTLLNKYMSNNKEIAERYLGRHDGLLFYDPLPSSDDSWEEYLGLSEEKIREISKFIAGKNPKVIKSLCAAITDGLNSKDDGIVEAANILTPALQYSENIPLDKGAVLA